MAIDPLKSDTFDEADRTYLSLYHVIVESIAKAFGDSCEVVLHSLEDVGRSVVKIENSHVTGRSVGAPLTDFGLQLFDLAEKTGTDVVGPYFTKSGKNTLRSVSVVLRNPAGKQIGYLCINIDLSAPFMDIVRSLLPSFSTTSESGNGDGLQAVSEPVEHFPSTVKDLVSQVLLTVTLPVGADRNRRMVEELYQRGIFRIKGSVDLVADELGVSKHTIYYYLRELRDRTEGGLADSTK
jgi:predicted transcriptional regulator YheO